MKVVLTRPNYNINIIIAPLGLGYLSSVLKSAGAEVKIIDGTRERLSNNNLLKRILAEKPDVVGINCVTAFYWAVCDLSKALKKNGIRVIIGGIHPTFLPYQTLIDSGADYVVCGEGEKPLLKLAENNFVNNGIKGVYSTDNLTGPDQITEKAQIIENLDDIPFPDWSQMPPSEYSLVPRIEIVKNIPFANIITSRGCPYGCTHCTVPKFYDRRIRFRSPENVVDEIQYLVEKFGVKEIHFEDDNLTLKREHIEKVCNLIIERKLDISCACLNGIRADTIDRDLVRLMKKSGFYCTYLGIESADPCVLKSIKKMEDIDTIEKAIRLLDSEGIAVGGYFIFGFPGDTKESIDRSIRFAFRSKLTLAQFFALDILPGCELWEELRGQFTPNWKKFSYSEPEWVPEGLTASFIWRKRRWAANWFYLRPRIFFRILRKFNWQIVANRRKYISERMSEC